MSNQVEILTIAEVSERLGISTRAVRRRLDAGELETVMVAGKRCVRLTIDASRDASDNTANGGSRNIDGGETEADQVGSVMEGNVIDTPHQAILAIPDITDDATTLHQTQPYMVRDVELIISRAIAEAITAAQTPLLVRIEELTATQISLVESMESQAEIQALRKEEIKQLKKDRMALVAALAAQAAAQDSQTAEIAALREEVDKLRQAQENPSEKTQENTQAAVETAMGKSLVPYLKHMRVLSATAETLKAENNLLETQLEMARRPWWKFWRR